MKPENKLLAEEYYSLISKKDSEKIRNYLHKDVEFYSPLATLKGQEAVLETTTKFMKSFESLKIRTSFGSEQQAMIVYDSVIPGISTEFPGASLLSFDENGLIIKIELFFDASSFR